jgi:hypothetical protein
MHRLITVLALAMLAGCARTPAGQQADLEREQKASFAVSAPYPRVEPINGLGATARYEPDTGIIRVANPTDQILTDITLWLDGAYVHHIPAIAPHSSIIINTRDFFDMRGHSAQERRAPVQRMEIQRDNELFSVPMRSR